MRNIQRLKMEVKALLKKYGGHRVAWASDCSWVEIKAFSLPKGFNKSASNLLIMIPDQYGYGVPIKEAYVDPELRILHRGKWMEIPHYFDGNKTYSPNQQVREQHWRYLCLHATKWGPGDTIYTFLQQIFTYLSDPFRWD